MRKKKYSCHKNMFKENPFLTNQRSTCISVRVYKELTTIAHIIINCKSNNLQTSINLLKLLRLKFFVLFFLFFFSLSHSLIYTLSSQAVYSFSISVLLLFCFRKTTNHIPYIHNIHTYILTCIEKEEAIQTRILRKINIKNN